MDELIKRPTCVIDDEQKATYASLWILKKMDLKPEDGGMVMPIVLPSELAPLDDLLHELAVGDLVAMNRKKERYEITRKGYDYLRERIDEAAALVDEFDDAETAEMIAELRRRRLDPFRARFLWAWYDGELDDLVVFQQRRGVSPVETLWAYYLVSDDLYNELARDLEA